MGTQEEQEAGLGLPSSTKLAKMIAEEFKVPFREGRSELDGIAALAAEEASDVSSVKAFVADAILDEAEAPLRAHKALARVAPPLVLTTNYDDLYEKALGDRGVRHGKIVHQGQLSAPAGRPRVVKLHGDATDHTTLVLTGEDYMRWETEAAGLVTDVTANFQRSPCVFIGYSLRDPNLRRIVGLVRSRGSVRPRGGTSRWSTRSTRRMQPVSGMASGSSRETQPNFWRCWRICRCRRTRPPSTWRRKKEP